MLSATTLNNILQHFSPFSGCVWSCTLYDGRWLFTGAKPPDDSHSRQPAVPGVNIPVFWLQWDEIAAAGSRN